MSNTRLLKTGLCGSALTALCCFTPLLIIALGAVGLSAWLAWLDFVLLPLLVIFAAITIYALVVKTRHKAADS